MERPEERRCKRHGRGAVRPAMVLGLALLLAGCAAAVTPADGAVSADAAAACRSASDCAAGQVCVFSTAGCGAPSICRTDRGNTCTLPFTLYCGCDGVTYSSDCNGFTHPFASEGSCDAGVPDAGPLHDCNPNHMRCMPGFGGCPRGLVMSFSPDGCGYDCVPFSTCIPMPCDPATPGSCPARFACDPAARLCAPLP